MYGKAAVLIGSESDRETMESARKYFDYFNDLNAATRVGEFIQGFIIEITKTNDVNHSLDACAKKYIEKNKVKKDFFESFSDWEVEI